MIANFLSGIKVDDYFSALKVAIALAFLNAIVKPILTVLTIPITVFTLGFFLLAINAIIILFAEKLVSGFYVDGFLSALLFSFILSIITGILNAVLGLNRREEE